MEKQSCRFSGCSPVEARLPYDEFRHEIDKNVLSVRVAKNVGRIKSVGGADGRDEAPCIRADCEDARGNKCCRPGCARLNVIPNKAPPNKQPDEELFLLRTSRQILSPEEMRNSLEIELRTPRNYAPLMAEPASPSSGAGSEKELSVVGPLQRKETAPKEGSVQGKMKLQKKKRN